MNLLSADIKNKPARPERILQFGEGVFLRAFADELIDKLNESGLFDGGIVIVPPTPRGSAEPLNRQDCLYTVLLRGLDAGAPKSSSRIITSVSRAVNAYTEYEDYIGCARNPELQIVISNTTEAGIAFDPDAKPDDKPPLGFPAKVAAFLYERWSHFDGDPAKGLAFMPCELIERNGRALRECTLRHARAWGYGAAFIEWVESSCVFADTLVDRIVTGYPVKEAAGLAAEFGYDDALLDAGELFHLWAIDAGADVDAAHADATTDSAKNHPPINLPELLPFHKIGLNVMYTNNVERYGTRKVRLLNGAHTALASCALIAGFDHVREAAAYPLFNKFLRKILFEEVPEALSPAICGDELKTYAESVLERFANPYINHNLSAIMLNATSKFQVRLLPSILSYHQKTGALPPMLTFSLAAFIAYNKVKRVASDGNLYYTGTRTVGSTVYCYKVVDGTGALDFFSSEWPACNNGRNGDRYGSHNNGHNGSCNGGLTIETLRPFTKKVLANEELWGMDLNSIGGLTEQTAAHLFNITSGGITAALQAAVENSQQGTRC